MRKLTEYEFPKSGSRGSRYDLDKLFDGSIYELKRGDDFAESAKVKSIRGYLGSAANSRGMSLQTHIKDENTLVIKATPGKQAARKPAPKRARSTRRPARRKQATSEGNGSGQQSGIKPGALV
jgi:hypothetical protein